VLAPVILPQCRSCRLCRRPAARRAPDFQLSSSRLSSQYAASLATPPPSGSTDQLAYDEFKEIELEKYIEPNHVGVCT